MDERLGRLEDKLDRVLEIQVEMQQDVAHHIYRTELAENNIEKIASQIRPVQEHVAFIRGLGRLVMAISAIGAALATVIQLIGGK